MDETVIVHWPLFAVAWGLAAASPGPATLAIAGAAMGQGRGAGLSLASGVILGSAFWGAAAALGMSALMLAQVWLMVLFRYVGAAYLLFLAYKALRSAMSDKALVVQSAGTRTLGRHFRRGLLIHLTNPKAIFAWGAVFAVAVPLGAGSGVMLGAYTSLLAVSVLVFWGYGVLFSAPLIARTYGRARRWFDGAFALMFGAAGMKILTARTAP